MESIQLNNESSRTMDWLIAGQLLLEHLSGEKRMTLMGNWMMRMMSFECVSQDTA